MAWSWCSGALEAGDGGILDGGMMLEWRGYLDEVVLRRRYWYLICGNNVIVGISTEC